MKKNPEKNRGYCPFPEEFKFENTQNVFSAGIIYIKPKERMGYGDYHVFWGMNTNGTETNKSVSDYWYIPEKEVMNYVYKRLVG